VANSKVYFYPGGSSYGGLNVIDFGERLSDLQITPYRVVSDSVSMGGSFCRLARRSGMRVRIVLERFTDETLAQQLYSLQSHLEAGGGFSFAVDDDKKFAAFVDYFSGGLFAYDLIVHDDLVLSEYGSHGLASDDVMHLESFGPGGRREELQVSSYDFTTKKITPKSSIMYNHQGPSLVRHRDFFPFLIWPEDQTGTPILTHDHRISYTLDFTCEVYPGAIVSAYGDPGTDGSNLQQQQGISDQQAVLDDLFGSIYGSADVDGSSLYIAGESVFDKMLNDYDSLG
tara:strand:+ start:2032 stop:2886 length:855 start_codon:yes stop_codon:yes gene_type:complete